MLTSPWVICAVALAVRLIALAMDAGGYHGRARYPIGTEIGRIAQHIAAGEGFSSPFIEPSGPTAWVAPVYPYLLAGAYGLFGTHTFAALMAILVFNCVCGALTSLLLHAIARRGFGRSVAVWSAWVWAAMPSLVNFPVRWVWETSLSALLLTTIVWMTLRIISNFKFEISDEEKEQDNGRPPDNDGRPSDFDRKEGTTLRMWGAWGALCGAAALTNPALTAPVPFLAIWAVWRKQRAQAAGRSEDRPLRGAALAAGMCLLVITPWLMRNYSVFGRWVFIRSNAGVELFLGNNPQVQDSWTFWLHPSESKEELARFRALGEPEYAAEKQRAALRFIAGNPGKFAMLTLNRFVYFWMGTWDALPDLWAGARLWPAINATLYAALALLAMVGLAIAMRTDAPAASAMGIVMLCYPAVYYVTHPILRFRHPVDALLVILAVVAAARIAQNLRGMLPRGSSRRSGGQER